MNRGCKNKTWKSPQSLTCISKRQISWQGFVEWQQQIYSSISNSDLVGAIQDGVVHYHDLTGLPWWATIITGTIIIRSSITLPLSVYQNYIVAKVENCSLELKGLVNELKKETAIAKQMYKLSDKQAFILFKRSLKKQWTNLIVRDNCHPFKASLLIWFQIPIWVCVSFSLRNLVNMQPIGDAAALVTFTELTVGGFGWIPNLTQPDASLILPIAFGITNLAIIELQNMSKLRQPSKLYKNITNVFRVFAVVMIPIAACVPSCMCLYWLTSSSIGLLQNLALLSPPLRRKLGIPIVPSEHEDPYEHIRQELKGKFQRLLPKKTLNE